MCVSKEAITTQHLECYGSIATGPGGPRRKARSPPLGNPFPRVHVSFLYKPLGSLVKSEPLPAAPLLGPPLHHGMPRAQCLAQSGCSFCVV